MFFVIYDYILYVCQISTPDPFNWLYTYKKNNTYILKEYMFKLPCRYFKFEYKNLYSFIDFLGLYKVLSSQSYMVSQSSYGIYFYSESAIESRFSHLISSCNEIQIIDRTL